MADIKSIDSRQVDHSEVTHKELERAGHTVTPTNALRRDVADILKEELRFLDFVPEPLHSAISNRTNTEDCIEYIEAAIRETCRRKAKLKLPAFGEILLRNRGIDTEKIGITDIQDIEIAGNGCTIKLADDIPYDAHTRSAGILVFKHNGTTHTCDGVEIYGVKFDANYRGNGSKTSPATYTDPITAYEYPPVGGGGLSKVNGNGASNFKVHGCEFIDGAELVNQQYYGDRIQYGGDGQLAIPTNCKFYNNKFSPGPDGLSQHDRNDGIIGFAFSGASGTTAALNSLDCTCDSWTSNTNYFKYQAEITSLPTATAPKFRIKRVEAHNFTGATIDSIYLDPNNSAYNSSWSPWTLNADDNIWITGELDVADYSHVYFDFATNTNFSHDSGKPEMWEIYDNNQSVNLPYASGIKLKFADPKSTTYKVGDTWTFIQADLKNSGGVIRVNGGEETLGSLNSSTGHKLFNNTFEGYAGQNIVSAYNVHDVAIYGNDILSGAQPQILVNIATNAIISANSCEGASEFQAEFATIKNLTMNGGVFKNGDAACGAQLSGNFENVALNGVIFDNPGYAGATKWDATRMASWSGQRWTGDKFGGITFTGNSQTIDNFSCLGCSFKRDSSLTNNFMTHAMVVLGSGQLTFGQAKIDNVIDGATTADYDPIVLASLETSKTKAYVGDLKCGTFETDGIIDEISYTATTISFVENGASPDTIEDSANGFVDAGFTAGKSITISGSTSNNIQTTITTVAAGSLTIPDGVLTAEVAGDTVTISEVYTTGNKLKSSPDSIDASVKSKNYLGIGNTVEINDATNLANLNVALLNNDLDINDTGDITLPSLFLTSNRINAAAYNSLTLDGLGFAGSVDYFPNSSCEVTGTFCVGGTVIDNGCTTDGTDKIGYWIPVISGAAGGGVNYSLKADGYSKFGAALDVVGLASLDGGIDVNSNFTVSTDGAIGVADLASLDGGIDVNSNFTVSTAGVVYAASNIDINGYVDVEEYLKLQSTGSGSTSIKSAAGISSNYTLTVNLGGSFTLTVSGSSAINQNVTTSGTPVFAQVTVDNIVINGNTISTSSGDLILDPTGDLDFNGNVITNSKFYVSGSGADTTLSASDSGQTFACSGSSDPQTITLPSCANGLKFTICGLTTSAIKIKVQAAAGDYIVSQDKGLGASGGYIQSATQDYINGPLSSITLIGNGTTYWMVTSEVGVWTQDA